MPIDLGQSPHHAITETYCDHCGVPESSNQHGMDCPKYLVQRVRPSLRPMVQAGIAHGCASYDALLAALCICKDCAADHQRPARLEFGVL